MADPTMESTDDERRHLARRKLLLLACTIAIVAGSVALLVSRRVAWRERGTTGILYNAPMRAGANSRIPAFVRKNSKSRIVMVAPGSTGERAGLRHGDVIVAVDGIPVAELTSPDREITIGKSATYRVVRDGRELVARVPLEDPLRLAGMRFSMWSSLLTAFVFLAISGLVFWTKPRSERAMVFYFMCASAAIVFVLYAIYEIEAMGSGVKPVGFSVSFWLTWTAYTCLAILMLCLLLHLALIFPRERPVIARFPRLRGWIYVAGFAGLILPTATIGTATLSDGMHGWLVSAALLAATAALVLLGRRGTRPGSTRQFVGEHPLLFAVASLLAAASLGPILDRMPKGYGIVVGLVFVLIILVYLIVVIGGYSIATCVFLYRGYRDADVEEKRQVKWPLWGTILSISAVSAVTLGIVVWSLWCDAPTPSMHYAGAAVKLLYVIIPVSFAFGILRYRVMDIDVIIRKTFVYGAATGIIVIAYLALVGGAGALLVRVSGVTSQLATIAGTLVIAALFIPLRNGLQTFVDRRFFRTKYDYPKALDAIGEATSAGGDLPGVLRAIAAALQQALQNRSVTIYARGEGSQALMPGASIGVPHEIFEKIRLAPRRSYAEPEPSVVPLADAELSEAERAKYRKLGAAMIVPVRHNETTIGVVTLGAKLGEDRWGDDDGELLAAAARQIAIALEASRARVDDTELRAAREIQETLLPKSIAQIPGFSISGVWLPARTMGGDYFDVLPLDRSRAGVCIADVVGKGMSAAILMSGLQASVRALAPEATSTAELCTKVRRLVSGNLSGGKFITFFYGEIDATRRTFRYSNAGHNPPLLVRGDASTTRSLHEGGHAIARLFAGSAIESAEVALERGDAIVLYTDGVTEATNADGEQFGEERLALLAREHLARDAAGIQASILDALRSWGDGEAQDDITLLVVKAE
ncbi:MAG: SpoIIE family protein phosphatase [Acidobacteria bacterium]|nr:SpoIIE family protein phosphatase [Acidobacteriota bacterium]